MSELSDPLPEKDQKMARRFGLLAKESRTPKDLPVTGYGAGAMCQQDIPAIQTSDIRPVKGSSGQPDGVNLDSYWSGSPERLNP